MPVRKQRFTSAGRPLPPLYVWGGPGDVRTVPNDLARTLEVVASPDTDATIVCPADEAIVLVEARLCADADGGSPGAWTTISSGAGLAPGVDEGETAYFQVRVTFADRDDAASYRLPLALQLSASGSAFG